MPILLDKVLTLLVTPLAIAVGVGLLALVALALGRRRMALGSLAFAIAWLWFWSMPWTSGNLHQSLTSGYPFRDVEAFPAADAIVVLGSIRPNPGAPAYPDLVETSDRAWHAARLYLAGKAPLIIVSAGNVWVPSSQQSTADATGILLEALGVPDSAIVIEGRSRNTRQNALFTAELADRRDIRRVLLATSVWHMRRAEAALRQVGLEVIPAATDYTFVPRSARRAGWRARPRIFRFLPSARALSGSTRMLKEHLGLLVYRFRGWA